MPHATLLVLLQATTATFAAYSDVWIPPVPDPLNWLFGIVGVVALMLAMITVPQVLWGRANIKIEFDTNGPDEDQVMTLRCVLTNMQPPKLIRPFVDRHAADATVALRIDNAQGQRIATLFPKVFTIGGERIGPRIQIPADPAFQPSFIVAFRDETGRAGATDGDKKVIALPAGAYQAHVIISHEARADQRIGRFVVAADTLYWIETR